MSKEAAFRTVTQIPFYVIQQGAGNTFRYIFSYGLPPCNYNRTGQSCQYLEYISQEVSGQSEASVCVLHEIRLSLSTFLKMLLPCVLRQVLPIKFAALSPQRGFPAASGSALRCAFQQGVSQSASRRALVSFLELHGGCRAQAAGA